MPLAGTEFGLRVQKRNTMQALFLLFLKSAEYHIHLPVSNHIQTYRRKLMPDIQPDSRVAPLESHENFCHQNTGHMGNYQIQLLPDLAEMDHLMFQL